VAFVVSFVLSKRSTSSLGIYEFHLTPTQLSHFLNQSRESIARLEDALHKSLAGENQLKNRPPPAS
jgi:hypothetical protein